MSYAVAVELQLEARIAAPPTAVWRYVTDPVRMNEWSLAPIKLLAAGDGDAADGVGAYRRVDVRARTGPVRLFEVIEHSEPPARLVYRVVRGPELLRSHRGELTLRDDGGATELRWQVRFDFAIPGVGALTRGELRGQLEASLEALTRVAAGAAVVPLPPLRPWHDGDLAPLHVAARSFIDIQRGLADELFAAADPKAWFARVYQYVTEGQLALIDGGGVTHREWALRLIPRFHAYYADNLARWRGRAPGHAETSWAEAFGFAESAGPRPAAQKLVGGLLLGVRAHIEEDLPRALAEVWLDHFATRCDYARFRADYLLMAPVFRTAADRLLDGMPRAMIPAWLRLARRTLPAELQDAITNRRSYDVPRRRLEAFERGGRLAAWARDRGSRPT